MKILVTGHTGFKGTWFVHFLSFLGHEISGLALEPEEGSLFHASSTSELLKDDFRLDIRDRMSLKKSLQGKDFDWVIHLAAQALVFDSYEHPLETFDTNVMGTLNILEICTDVVNADKTLVITSDKVYRNLEILRGYSESDPLGGADPYSASKASADIAAQSYLRNFATRSWAIARAGNVIGGGDWAKNRLIPDIIHSLHRGESIELRNPTAIRPWQHVLDCLNGYLTLIKSDSMSTLGNVWNFGPEIDSSLTVSRVTSQVLEAWGTNFSDVKHTQNSNHESGYLLLDSSKARRELNWSDKLSFSESIEFTVSFYRDLFAGKSAQSLVNSQIKKFMEIQ